MKERIEPLRNFCEFHSLRLKDLTNQLKTKKCHDTVGARKPNVFCIRMVNSVWFAIQTRRKPNKQDGREKIFSLGRFKHNFFSSSIKRPRLIVILFVPIWNDRFHRRL